MCKMSPTIASLASALVKAQGEITPVAKDGANPHFKSKYSTLDNIIEATKPILTKHGLTVLQMAGGDGENIVMRTILMHESGEWLETEPFVMRPVKNDPQGMGSATTYARRYSYSALLSIATEEDDDGNGASQRPAQPRQQAQAPTYQPQSQQAPSSHSSAPRPISDAQIKMLGAKKNVNKVDDEGYRRILSGFGVQSTKDLKSSDVNQVVKMLEEYKPAEDDLPS